MRVGFNYPNSHNRFGCQIGPDYHCSPEEWAKWNRLETAGDVDAIPLPPMFEKVNRNLTILKNMGVSVVRWFLLGNGSNYGEPPGQRFDLPRPDAKSMGTRYAFVPPTRIDRRFKRDFAELLRRFRNAKMQIIPSLISFEFGGNDKSGPDANGRWFGGRADAICLKPQRTAFLDTMLGEMLIASRGFENEIYAWEVINEPIWLCTSFGPLSPASWVPRTPEVTFQEMTDFLNDAIRRIHAAGFRSTVGHRYYDDLAAFPTPRVDKHLPQFHYYAERRLIVRVVTKNDPLIGGLFKPDSENRFAKPFLGEFDSAHDASGAPWVNDLPPGRDTTLARLQHLEKSGCDLALIWPDMPDTEKVVVVHDVIKMLSDTRKAIAEFTGGVAPTSQELYK